MDPFSKCDDGLNVLHVACRENSIKTVEFLLKREHDLINSITDKKSEFTPLHFAVYNKSKELIKMLLSNGANKNMKDKDGKSAIEMTDDEEIKNLFNDVIDSKKTVISNDMVCTKDNFNMILGASSDSKLLSEILSENPHCFGQIQGQKGNNILHMAALHCDINIFNAIKRIDIPYDVLNKKNDDGYTPMHLLFLNNKKEAEVDDCVMLMLEREFDSGIMDNRGHTALDYAINNGFVDISHCLIKHFAGKIGKIIDYATIIRKEGMLEALLSQKEISKYVATAMDEKGNGLIYHLAVCYLNAINYPRQQKTFWSSINRLIESDGSFSKSIFTYQDGSYNTCLHFIARNWHIKKLLDFAYNEEIDVLDSNGNTPLWYAFNWNNFDAFRFFLSKEADVSLPQNSRIYILAASNTLNHIYINEMVKYDKNKVYEKVKDQYGRGIRDIKMHGLQVQYPNVRLDPSRFQQKASSQIDHVFWGK